jgi:hypothetical protein
VPATTLTLVGAAGGSAVCAHQAAVYRVPGRGVEWWCATIVESG